MERMSEVVKRIRRILTLSLLLCGGLAILMLSSIPSWWVYNYLAVRKAFGPAPPAGVKVEQIKKPHTVTFSNGKTVDVGAVPATLSNVAHFGLGIPAVLVYFYVIMRKGPAWFRSGKWMRQGVSIVED
jgi:hypothetical protein